MKGSLFARRGLAPLLVLLAAAGCDSAQDPSLDALAFSRQVGLDQFQQQVDPGPARVRITFGETGLVARRVQIKRADQLGKAEKIDSRIDAISTSGSDGTITLALGGLKIGFNASTRFRAEDDELEEQHDDRSDGVIDHDGDEDGEEAITAADFVNRVETALAAGRHPAVEARRAAPTTPQAADDASFVAQEIRLNDDDHHAKIEMNVTRANLLANATPPPDAWIQVLGLKIELRVTEGLTRLEAHTPRAEGALEFRGTVKSVDVAANTVLLANGTILRIVAGTHFEGRDDDEHDGNLASLADVKAALDAGKTVVAKGEGLLETASPRTLDVIEVRFRIPESGS